MKQTKELATYLRRYRRHFNLPKIKVERRNVLALEAFGICFPPPGGEDGTYLILLDTTLTGNTLRDVLMHELAHAEAMSLHWDYGHGEHWLAVCGRVSAATGITIE